jgi:hypothetical protein
MSNQVTIERFEDLEGHPRIEYKIKHNPDRVELFSLVIHENLAIPVEEITREKNYDCFIFKDFEPINVEKLTDEVRFDIMCQFQNLFAFLEANGYQVTGIDISDVTLLEHEDIDKDNHILIHNIEVKKPKHFRPDNDYMIKRCAEMLGNPKILGELRNCRRMKSAFVLKNSRYIQSVRKFNS